MCVHHENMRVFSEGSNSAEYWVSAVRNSLSFIFSCSVEQVRQSFSSEPDGFMSGDQLASRLRPRNVSDALVHTYLLLQPQLCVFHSALLYVS